MGLSSKQVSGEGFHWGESLMQTGALQVPKLRPPSGPPLKCPRCESTNTKFCYFNNYNQSQPRHFCKACKRHWTKGGTLRDVPVGGGRRNKRLKTKSAVQSQQRDTVLPLKLNEEKKFHDILHQTLLEPTASLQPLSSAEFMHSRIPLPNLLSTAFTSFSNTSSFEPQFGLSMASNYSDEAEFSETTTAITMTPVPGQWHTPTPSSATDTPGYWNLEDFNTFMSTDANEPWDDSLEQQ